MILNDILKTKRVSVWGLGYLAFTSILKLQNSGFSVVAYDLNTIQMREFLSGRYPDRKKVINWSKTGHLPKIDYDKITVVSDPAELFKSSYLHMIAIPEYQEKGAKEYVATKLARLFAKNLKKSSAKPLVIFESAFVPGHIEKNFVSPLKKMGITCPKNYYLGGGFRTDWNIEAFMDNQSKMPIAGHCDKSLAMTRELFTYLGIRVLEMNTIKEAEIYVNSLHVIQSMINDFVRQLSLGYSFVNMRKVAEMLFKNVSFEDCALNMGTGGEKMTYAIDYLMRGSDNPDALTLLKEFQDINISSVLNYAEYIIRHGYKRVAILGITYRGDQKDIILSPSVTLANHLIKNAVKIMVHDPVCSEKEIHGLVKGAEVTDFPKGAFTADALILASDHGEYRYLSEKTLNTIKKKPRLIIDNYGIWSGLSFGKKVRYHQVGDGSLNLIR